MSDNYQRTGTFGTLSFLTQCFVNIFRFKDHGLWKVHVPEFGGTLSFPTRSFSAAIQIE